MINKLPAFSPCPAIGVTLKVFLISTILYPVRTDKPNRKHMKAKVATTILAVAGLGMANAATVIGEGAESPFTGGTPDGWSGVSVMNTAVIDSSTEGGLVEVTQVSMFAGAGRAGGSHHLQAILVDSNNLITWISPELTPTQEGLNVFPISGAGTIDATAGDLRLGVWQWNDGQDDNAGGTVAFAGGGGGGMFQQNLNGSLGADAISIGHDTGGGQQHASGAGGRDYHISVTVAAIPEPTVFPLIALSGLGLLLRRRRS